MVTLTRERVQWRTAAPLWPAAAEGQLDVGRPAILRFAGDDFMDRVGAVLTAGGQGLDAFLARPETWRQPSAGLPLDADPTHPLKLWQPLQGRFYLLGATLVCSRRGLPDRIVDPARAESAFYVLRQLRRTSPGVQPDPGEPSTFSEHGWVAGAAGTGSWQPVAPGGLVAGEQRLPLFGVCYEALGARRKLLAGMIPVGAREVLRSAPALPAKTDPTDPFSYAADPRIAPLVPLAAGMLAIRQAPAGARTEDVREALFFAALDLADLIAEHLNAVWTSTGPLAGKPDAELLRKLLAEEFLGPTTWLQALRVARQKGPVQHGDTLPAPLATIGMDKIRGALDRVGITTTASAPTKTTLFRRVTDALLETPAAKPAAGAGGNALEAAATPGDAADEEDAVLVARCAYERPNCPPEERLRLSAPSAPFVFASLYDPDGPVRPSQIAMPNDMSLATLRRMPKGVGITLSKELRRQVERFQAMKLTEIENGPGPEPNGLSLGMVCQLSIPIITICALILLMVIVFILNIVFWWLPFFKICIPTVRRG